MKKGFIFGIAITLLVVVSVAGAYYLGTKNKKAQDQSATAVVDETQAIPTQEFQQPQKTEVAKSDIPTNWLTYTNEKYGFEISYPPNYKALDDAENLYGWPDALVLIYGGGQSYDLPIEVWNTQSEYENKYPNAENITVKLIGNKYITLLNMNFEEEVDTIIETFRTF